MLVVGLTGSIGMGKSAAAEHFARRGVPVFNADAEVHRLYQGKAVAAVSAVFPQAIVDGQVDRALLSAEVAGAPSRLRALERIVHPLVVAAEIAFLFEEEDRGAPIAVLEIPLLFETGAEARVDVAIAMSAPEAVQTARVLARPGMTEAKLASLLARQMPDAEKRARADYVVDSGTSLEDMQREIDKLLVQLANRQGQVMRRLRAQRHTEDQ